MHDSLLEFTDFTVIELNDLLGVPVYELIHVVKLDHRQ